MSRALRCLVGIVFLLSGLLKSTDASAFANLMSGYGASWLGYGTPLVIFTETLLGLLLAVDVRPRLTVWLSVAFLLFVSQVFLYGVAFRGVTDCGCFGPLTFLNAKPWVTFVRNGVLALMLVFSLLIPGHEGSALTPLHVSVMTLYVIVVMFLCGYSFNGADCMKTTRKFNRVALSDSPLGDFVACSPDSSYLVFAFSYSCPYCLNSIGNVSQYEPMGAVDRVIGIALEDTAARERFDRLFDVDFEIREVSRRDMNRLTGVLPTSFIIRGDTIVSRSSGMVVSPALLVPQ